jgi:ArsR family transcriptional regulator, arsenate/arsenite/antimonite-responsive transcriptional repressor
MLTDAKIRSSRKTLNETDKDLAATFKALGDTTRLRIFRLLTNESRMSVSTVAKILHISSPLTSQHIKVLVNVRLIEKQRTGKKIFSRLDRRNPVVRELVRTIRRSIKTKS